MTIIGRNEFPPLLVSLSFLLYFIVMLNDLLAVYDQIDKIIARGRSDAYQATDTLRNFMKMRDRLDAYRQLTGLGFFDIDKGLVTSFLSTTLSYIIILIQSEPLLNPNGE